MNSTEPTFPRTLYLCRHGQSEANVANARAIAAGAAALGPVDDDRDVRLTALGELQARALGAYLERQQHPPRAIVTSPFRRCYETARIAGESLDIVRDDILADPRLRERNLGLLDRLTPIGIRERYPQEAAARAAVGKYAYRPPNGESWMDVADRVRAVCDALFERFAGSDVAVITHQAVILCMRYVIEGLTITELGAIDQASEVRNCGVTSYAFVDRRLQLTAYNVDPLEVETPHA